MISLQVNVTMRTTDPIKLVKEIIEAHGGESYWNSLDGLDVEISVSGFLFTAKHRPFLDHVRVRASAKEPRFTFHDFPRKGLTGEMIGDEEVIIKDADGRVLDRRKQPRAAFSNLRRQLYWDDLDFIYFGGYATWNYLTAPFLFLRPGFTFEMLDPLPGEFSHWQRLRVRFPADIPTHSETQEFYFDEDLHLRRLDYEATVIGRWAHAAHLCEEYRVFGGLQAPTRRRVRPLMLGTKPLPWPVLVALDIHDIHPVF
jgi:hypothetical protein